MTEFKNLKKCIGNIGQQNIVERFFFLCVCVWILTLVILQLTVKPFSS